MVLRQIGSAHQPTAAGPITEGLKLMTHLSRVVIMSVDVNSLSLLDINTFHFVMYLFNSFYMKQYYQGMLPAALTFVPKQLKAESPRIKCFFANYRYIQGQHLYQIRHIPFTLYDY